MSVRIVGLLQCRCAYLYLISWWKNILLEIDVCIFHFLNVCRKGIERTSFWKKFNRSIFFKSDNFFQFVFFPRYFLCQSKNCLDARPPNSNQAMSTNDYWPFIYRYSKTITPNILNHFEISWTCQFMWIKKIFFNPRNTYVKFLFYRKKIYFIEKLDWSIFNWMIKICICNKNKLLNQFLLFNCLEKYFFFLNILVFLE